MHLAEVLMYKIGKKCFINNINNYFDFYFNIFIMLFILYRWGPLIGKGRAFDPTKFFIFCGNMLASPYGTASPVTTNPETGKCYGPEFPLTTPRDDVW